MSDTISRNDFHTPFSVASTFDIPHRNSSSPSSTDEATDSLGRGPEAAVQDVQERLASLKIYTPRHDGEAKPVLLFDSSAAVTSHSAETGTLVVEKIQQLILDTLRKDGKAFTGCWQAEVSCHERMKLAF
jgi:hypothetical protein